MAVDEIPSPKSLLRTIDVQNQYRIRTHLAQKCISSIEREQMTPYIGNISDKIQTKKINLSQECGCKNFRGQLSDTLTSMKWSMSSFSHVSESLQHATDCQPTVQEGCF